MVPPLTGLPSISFCFTVLYIRTCALRADGITRDSIMQTTVDNRTRLKVMNLSLCS